MAELERIVAEHGARFAPRHVGLALGVTQHGIRAVVGSGRTGPQSHRPDGRTIFQIGSVTKVFTGLLLADAVCRGEVTLDQHLATLLPDIGRHSRGRSITLADLATHSSGLPRLPPGLRRQALRHRDDPYAALTTRHVQEALARSPRRPPGRVRYSNFGAGALGHALEHATGRRFDELVRDRIADPLGLADTVITMTAEQRTRAAAGHSRRGRTVTDWQLPALPAAGALRSTVDDLLVFIDAHLQGNASPLSAAVSLAMRPRVALNRHVRVGLGWLVLERRGTTLWWHNGGTGGFRSFVALEPSSACGVVALTNCARSVDRVGMTLLERVRSQPGGA